MSEEDWRVGFGRMFVLELGLILVWVSITILLLVLYGEDVGRERSALKSIATTVKCCLF